MYLVWLHKLFLDDFSLLIIYLLPAKYHADPILIFKNDQHLAFTFIDIQFFIGPNFPVNFDSWLCGEQYQMT